MASFHRADLNTIKSLNVQLSLGILYSSCFRFSSEILKYVTVYSFIAHTAPRLIFSFMLFPVDS